MEQPTPAPQDSEPKKSEPDTNEAEHGVNAILALFMGFAFALLSMNPKTSGG